MVGIIFGGASIALGVFYLQSMAHQKEGVRRDVLHLAQSLAHLVDVEAHEQLVDESQMGSPLHLKTLEPLVRFHLKIPEIHYVYTIRAIDGREFFVLDTAYDKRVQAMRGDVELSRIMEEFDIPEDVPAALPAMLRGEAYVYDLPYTDDFGEFISAQAPLFNKAGEYLGYAGVDYDITDYRRRVGEIRLAGAGALAVAFFLSLIIANLTRRMREDSLAQMLHREAMEQSMRQAKERAEAATQAKSEMLAMATHDLKNPLTAIKGRSELILIRHEAESQAATAGACREQDLRAIRSIHEAATDMADRIERVLAAERLTQRGPEGSNGIVNLSAECLDLLVLHRILAEKKMIRINARVQPGIRLVGDGARLREAFENLVSNAIKYSPHGSRVDVELRQGPDEGQVQFIVSDQGPGVLPGERDRLFGRFQRLSAEPTGGETSTGLGLYIVKTIIEAHGGEVGCDSEPGQGSRFWIRLPLERAEEPEATPPP